VLFDTLDYWLFLAATLLLLAALCDRSAKCALLGASYVFYGFWDWRFCFLLATSTAANYLFGRMIEACDGARRKLALTLAVAFNLLVLGFFKYCNFFIDSFASLFGLDRTGLALNIVLPVGISFFTFEGIAYAVDVYRRQLPAVYSKIDFALFISFFPHLVAGPIIRPTDFFPQLAQRPLLTSEDSRWGLREILKGLIKKIAFANYFAPIAEAYFSSGKYAGVAVPAWAGVLAFSLQIYFDFSGYTDIARGCARLLGYRFPSNFERPYLSADITDFWRRWHISLSLWLRDYLYISLGGNRVGVPRTYLNLVIVMGLGGIWHGASWNFLVWGLYHGALLIVHRLWRRLLSMLGLASVADMRALQPVWVACTFVLVTLGWVPFRAPSFAATRDTLIALFAWPDLSFAAEHSGLWLIPLATLGFCLIDRRRRVQDWLLYRPGFWTVSALGAACMWLLAVLGRVDQQVPFVYFQF
jgi:alginate O-acetyltransferase complex protein AlgI